MNHPPAPLQLVSSYRIPLIVAILAIIPLPFLGSLYLTRMFVLFVVFTLFTIALNIVFGHTDQLYLFSGALAGIGAYVTALLSTNFGLPAWGTLWIGVLFAGIVASAVSYVAARRKLTVVVIAILTLSLQLAVIEFFAGFRSLTGGDSGIPWSGFDIQFLQSVLPFTNRVILYYLLLVALLLVLYLYDYLINSKYGLAFAAIRQDQHAAYASGINIVKYQSFAGFVGGCIIGFTGTMYAHFNGFVMPSMFTFASIDVFVLIMLILGGMRTRSGPIVGAAVLLTLTQVLQLASELRMAIFGLLLLGLFIFFPKGIVPIVVDRLNALSEFLTDRQAADQHD